MLIPRDYQNDAHNALIEYLHNPAMYGKNPLVVEATGLGKSLNIAMFFYHMLTMYPHLRMMQLTHVKELIQGNYEELLGMWPMAPAGIYSSGLKRKDTHAQITFAGIQSVHRRPETFGRIDFVVIDEAHLLNDKGATMYMKFITALRVKNPNLVVIGFTATAFRMGMGSLLDGKMFDDIVYDIGSGDSFNWAIDNGYLIRPVPVDVGNLKVDDSNVDLSAGDFKDSSASEALHEQDIIERAVDYTIEIARKQGRRACLTFAQSIDDAELIAEMLTYKGFPTEAVHSRRTDREDVLRAFKAGELWGVVNKNILTTGFNNPNIDLMVVLRLTRSPGLWVQMVGRTTRPVWLAGHDISTIEGRLASIAASHKQNALVLDFVGNTERLGPINYPNLPVRRGKGGGEAPVRTCKQCEPNTYHHVSVKICPHCGYEWPQSTNLTTKASTAELVGGIDLMNPPEAPDKVMGIHDVHQMLAVRNNGRNGKNDTLKVTYRSGLYSYNQWLCFDHEKKSYPRKKANQWWKQHNGRYPIPEDVGAALERFGELQKPKFIEVWENTKFPEITRHDHEGTKFVLNIGGEQELYEPTEDPLKVDEEALERARAMAMELVASTMGYDDSDIPF